MNSSEILSVAEIYCFGEKATTYTPATAAIVKDKPAQVGFIVSYILRVDSHRSHDPSRALSDPNGITCIVQSSRKNGATKVV